MKYRAKQNAKWQQTNNENRTKLIVNETVLKGVQKEKAKLSSTWIRKQIEQ